MLTIKFTTSGSRVVRDIYYNYVSTVQVSEELFLMMRGTPRFVYLWECAFMGGAHRNIR